MAPKRRRQTQVTPEVETPPPATAEIGTLAEQAILRSLGEMTSIFKDWATSQGQGQRGDPGQGRELEQKQRHDFNS